ncbi:hypothetical protein SAMN04490357_3602 [Streptomyces misionensis]|uniref:Uncharacterized protein n=1 Tax=Streptomyces misionensis TaxID=67331 RepID=A0A1H4XC60_9ACTN|nr:hypothetical protein [Streptomyces misionensis]SED03167.1 hypothetical protein SAMN04490357_3602 [Streptomyces misionensis]
MHDISASTRSFLSDLSSSTEELKREIEAARREREEIAARIATLEMRLAENTATLRAMQAYASEADGTRNDEEKARTAASASDQSSLTIEECILHVLCGRGGLLPLEITRKAEAMGVTSSASSIRARLTKLHKEGTVVRDSQSRYWLAAAGTEATRDG